MSQGLPPAHGAPQPYDYRAAAQSLNSLIDRLRPGAQPGGPDAPSQIASAMRFWRGNWRSVLALLTLYSIPTGAVMALVFAQRQTRADQLWYEEQKRHLRSQMAGVRIGMERDRQLLRSFRDELERLEGAWRLAPARAALMRALRPPPAAGEPAQGGLAAGAPADAAGAEPSGDFALRPGPQGPGRGFMI